MTDPARAQIEAIATLGGVLTDLVQIAERLPVQPGRAEPVAATLDRLAAEIGEAATMLRTAGRHPPLLTPTGRAERAAEV